MNIPSRHSRGFSLISALFLVVVLAALGAYALSVSSLQHAGAAAEFLGSRAYQAARAGLEWGLYQSANGSCASADFSPGGTLAEFTVSVRCTVSSYDELGKTVNIHSITATACNKPAASCPNNAAGQGYVERQLSATLER
ncbi:MAG: hypothetical protein KF778_19025 [Rhodocyclaceae bacterium]|nr:hypothetical protein [Rhodocyclaceae bacterium]MBX3670500.1 hypothetical protein [Rhodocyclaceae bacterium]